MNAIEIINLSKRYYIEGQEKSWFHNLIPFHKRFSQESIMAVNNINCSIKKGTMFGIVGQNGSGKSTLLRMISGITAPTSGKIIANGRISALLELGVGFHPELSGMENIFLYGSALKIPSKILSERIDKIIEFSEIGDFINSPVKHYSSGMYARLAFSVAINVDPDIILVDEILSVGDAKFQSKSFEKIQEFRSKGKTIIFVAHNITLAEQICDELMMLENGSVHSIGSPKSVAFEYRKFISSKVKEYGFQSENTWFNELDFNAEPELFESPLVKLLKFEIKDKDGQVKDSFKTLEKMEVSVEFEHSKKIESCRGYLIITKDDGAIMSVLKTDNIDYGKKQIIFTLDPLTLWENDYYISFVMVKESTPKEIILKSLKSHFIKVKTDNNIAKVSVEVLPKLELIKLN